MNDEDNVRPYLSFIPYLQSLAPIFTHDAYDYVGDNSSPPPSPYVLLRLSFHNMPKSLRTTGPPSRSS